jgi:hypothetical protein
VAALAPGPEDAEEQDNGADNLADPTHGPRLSPRRRSSPAVASGGGQGGHRAREQLRICVMSTPAAADARDHAGARRPLSAADRG